MVERHIKEVDLECPFCHKMGVKAQYFPPSISAKTSRTSAKSTTKIYRVGERYEGISGCRFCGKSDKEVKKALEDGIKNSELEKKIMERLKRQGLSFNEIRTKF
ncbi:MAG: hypothetical protein QXY45_00345 [Candidatus Aenigmatarchaeota archaeon]